MPTIPKIITLTNAADEVLNTIREHASVNFREFVPFAQPNADSIREIGAIIMEHAQLQNEFVDALVNRIGLVLAKSMSFENPWAIFKRGTLDFGESIEEIWVDIAKPHEFSAEVAETELFKREKPDIRSAFHYLNWTKFYKVTIERQQLEKAFLSYNGVNDLIERIMSRLVVSVNYDEFLTMRYLLARNILSNHFYYIPAVGALTEAGAKETLAKVREVTNLMTFPSQEYNVAGVLNFSAIEDQYVIIDSSFEAHIDVNALAYAFNIDYANFRARRILTPHFKFSPSEIARLDLLFEYDNSYKGISEAENALLEKVYAVIIDRDYFMIFDKLIEMRDQPNGQGLYWNYMYHAWKLFSVSPFHNAVALVDTTSFVPTKTPDIQLVDMVTGEAISSAETLQTGVRYGINVVGNPATLPVGGIVDSVEFADGTAEFGDNYTSVVFTSFGELNTGDDVELTVTYTNGEEQTTAIGNAP